MVTLIVMACFLRTTVVVVIIAVAAFGIPPELPRLLNFSCCGY
jgi:hypothetical protein